MSRTRTGGIPPLPAKTPRELRPFLESIREGLEVQLGRRGKAIDRAVTFRDLADGGIASLTANGSGISLQPPPAQGGGGTADTPTQPTNFNAQEGIDFILLTWDMPSYTGHSFTEVWRITEDTNDPNQVIDVGSAVLIGTSNGFMYSDRVDPGSAHYYWIRFVNINDATGPYEPSTAGLYAETATSYDAAIVGAREDVLAALAIWQQDILDAYAILDNDTFQLILNTQGAIDTLNQQITATEGRMTAEYNSAVTAAANESGAAVQKVEELKATIFLTNPDGTVKTDASGNQLFAGAFATSVDAVMAGTNGELMAAIGDTLTITDGSGTNYSLSQVMSIALDADGAYQSQWGIKTSINDLQYGVGFVSYTDEFNQPQTSFNVAAHTFSIHNPANGTEVIPFIVDVNGNVLIDTAIIDTATISTLIADTIITDELFAGKQITSPILNGGEIHIGAAFDVSASGEVEASNLVIKDNLNNILLSTKPGVGTFIDGAYITNLAVDTLMIEDNAVTVPLYVESPNVIASAETTILDYAFTQTLPATMLVSLSVHAIRQGDTSSTSDAVSVRLQIFDGVTEVTEVYLPTIDADHPGSSVGHGHVFPVSGAAYIAGSDGRVVVRCQSKVTGQDFNYKVTGFITSAKR